jgi:hypothetical protein
MNNFLFFEASRNHMRNGVDIWIAEGNRKQNLVTDMTMRIEPFDDIDMSLIRDPSMVLSLDSAQSLMDALWDAGVKPSGGEGHTAHIRALNAHLDDMRKLVFKNEEGIK